eukprot:GAHX01002283.1.p1 GENE.GAHX01002283.1~~GAHX01002283.1.p1  ORF type:complete len:775 (+),score=138.15 GAHX01002283.1:86-2410(+)
MKKNKDNRLFRTEHERIKDSWEQLQYSRGIEKPFLFSKVRLKNTNVPSELVTTDYRTLTTPHTDVKLYFDPKLPSFLKETNFDPYYTSEKLHETETQSDNSSLFLEYYKNGSLLLSYYREKVQNNRFIQHYSSIHNRCINKNNKDNLKKPTSEELPIFKMKKQIVSHLIKNQVIIIRGQTGSGKTTIIPQIVKDMFNGTIICTQPRRVAAISIAEFVSYQRKVILGTEVGYTVRFVNKTSSSTNIKYVTEGILLKELMGDKQLSNYSHIMIDEAHERTLNTDLILGMLKRLIRTRKDIRIIISSATLDTESFSTFFNKPPILDIPGNLYEVTVNYQNVLSNKLPDYLEEIYKKIMSLHVSKEKGDILVLMPGAEEIEALCQLCFNTVKANEYEPLVLLPLYSILAPYKQKLVFESFKARKCVITTNIAETSLTVPGIKFVIDCGFVKVKQFIPKLGVDVLRTTPISKQSAIQRAGRAGRLEHGHCFRMYDEKIYRNMENNLMPEILRSNLNSVILKVLGLGIESFSDFDLINNIEKELIYEALYRLHTLRALDNEGHLTKEGAIINEIPFDPNLGRMIVYSAKYGLVNDTIGICSMISVNNNVFLREQLCEEAEMKLESYRCPNSDHITLLNILDGYLKTTDQERFCNDICVNKKALERATDIYKQVTNSVKNKLYINKQVLGNKRNETLRKIVCSGSLHTLSIAKKIGIFENLRSLIEAKLHPTSSLYNLRHDTKALVYNDLIVGKNTYINIATEIDVGWIYELGVDMYGSYK